MPVELSEEFLSGIKAEIERHVAAARAEWEKERPQVWCIVKNGGAVHEHSYGPFLFATEAAAAEHLVWQLPVNGTVVPYPPPKPEPKPEPELRKCRCGSPAVKHSAQNAIRCRICMAETPNFPTIEQAIAAWNRMMEPEAVR